jgi:glycerophosphoryl diester phosphodiesterase
MEILKDIVKYCIEIRVEIINLILFLILAFGICLLIKKKWTRVIAASIFSLFFSLQLVSLYFVDGFIGYQFYVHFNVRDIGEMLNLYTDKIFFLLAFAFIIFSILYHSKKISQVKKLSSLLQKRYFYIIAVALSAYFMNTKRGILNTSFELISMLHVTEKSFDKTLEELGMEEYTYPKDLKAIKGKNIIILSLESLEKAYLETPYTHLTPNLNKLKDRWNYFPMEQNYGSSWTSGSLYTLMTGFPAYFGVHGNSIFQKAYYTNISSISHVLKKAGYQMTFMSTSSTMFSGTEGLLHTFDIHTIIDPTSLGKKIKDKDLFSKAKTQVQSLTKEGKPFALFLSTMDTHFPNGIYDKRMEDFVNPQQNDLQFMVSAVDYMIKDFINYLKDNNLLSNTVIFIFPDHLKMGRSPLAIDDHRKRELYLITNADSLTLKRTDNLYQIDLPNIILDGAEIQHNATFLTNYVSGDKNQFIKDHSQTLTSLNNAGIARLDAVAQKPLSLSKKYHQYVKDTLRFIAHAGGKIDKYIYTNSLEALNLNYQKGFRLFELDIIKTSDGAFVAAHDWDHWAETTGYTGEVPVTKDEFLKQPIRGRYTSMDMKAINQWFSEHPDAILVTDKINDPKAFSKQFVDKQRLMMELFSWDAVKEASECTILSPIVSQNVLQNLKENKIEQLKKLGVKAVAISRNFIADNIELLKNLQSNDIKAYAYHVNFALGKDEKYVVKYEMDHIYGIYADIWDFSKE